MRFLYLRLKLYNYEFFKSLQARATPVCLHLPSQLPEYKHDDHGHHQHCHEDDGEEEEKNEYDQEQELTSDLLSLASDLSLEQLQP